MMSTPKLPHSTSADRSTKVMGLGLRDVNESLAGSVEPRFNDSANDWYACCCELPMPALIGCPSRV